VSTAGKSGIIGITKILKVESRSYSLYNDFSIQKWYREAKKESIYFRVPLSSNRPHERHFLVPYFSYHQLQVDHHRLLFVLAYLPVTKTKPLDGWGIPNEHRWGIYWHICYNGLFYGCRYANQSGKLMPTTIRMMYLMIFFSRRLDYFAKSWSAVPILLK